MLPDKEGFLYPSISDDLCIKCGLCEQVCPIINVPKVSDNYVDCVVAQSTEENVLKESTSGGFVDALCRHVLENMQGHVVGVCYDENMLPIHKIVDTYDLAEAFRNSKYAQSNLQSIFCDIKTLLNGDKTVLFVGTPCQVAGLKSFLRRDYKNLFTVDLVCRSIPSPKLWRQYLDWQEDRHCSKVKKVACRKKTYGYHSGALEIEFENGKHYAGSNRVDYYMKAFHHDICSRPSCYECQFKTKHRCSDFTVFDSWKPEQVTEQALVDNDKGYSNVIVHTDKGKEILYQVDKLKITKANAEAMFRFTGEMESKSIKLSEERKTFYVDLERVGFYHTVRKYISVSVKDQMIEFLKPLRYYFKHKK